MRATLPYLILTLALVSMVGGCTPRPIQLEVRLPENLVGECQANQERLVVIDLSNPAVRADPEVRALLAALARNEEDGRVVILSGDNSAAVHRTIPWESARTENGSPGIHRSIPWESGFAH